MQINTYKYCYIKKFIVRLITAKTVLVLNHSIKHNCKQRLQRVAIYSKYTVTMSFNTDNTTTAIFEVNFG